MRRRMLSSKIHRATVTDARLDYEGSITVDESLLSTAGILEYEQVTVASISTGVRFETYAIAGAAGEVCVNGAAARLVQRGDLVIIMSYADYAEADLAAYKPNVVLVGPANQPL